MAFWSNLRPNCIFLFVYQNAIHFRYPIIKVIAIVVEHYGPVERMRPHNAEAKRSGSHQM